MTERIPAPVESPLLTPGRKLIIGLALRAPPLTWRPGNTDELTPSGRSSRDLWRGF